VTGALPILTATVFCLDQATKALVVRALPARGAPGLRLVLAGRVGFGPASTPVLVVLWSLTAAFLVLASLPGLPFADPVARAGLAAALGGAAGNIADRVRRGVVVDFVALGAWPPFNLADAAIVTGVGLALLSLA
jgi:signal peptidase II